MVYNIDKLASNKKIIFFIGFSIGLAFFLLVFGYQVIDVTYIDWIWEEGSDLPLPYLGWVFYRKSEGGILSGITSLAYPHKVSVIYTDINAAVAIVCKLFSDFLPDVFQYIGVTTFLQYGLQGGLTAVLANKWTKRWEIVITAVCFSCMSTFVTYRTFVHYTLSMQWIIIAGFCLWAYREELGKTFDILWILLIPVSAMTHLYFVPILEIIFVCSEMSFVLKRKDKISLIRGGIILIVGLSFTLIYLILFGRLVARISGYKERGNRDRGDCTHNGKATGQWNSTFSNPNTIQ